MCVHVNFVLDVPALLCHGGRLYLCAWGIVQSNCLCGMYILYYSNHVYPDKDHQSKRHIEMVKFHSYGVVWQARPFRKS